MRVPWKSKSGKNTVSEAVNARSTDVPPDKAGKMGDLLPDNLADCLLGEPGEPGIGMASRIL
jgi:hypothetical protein